MNDDGGTTSATEKKSGTTSVFTEHSIDYNYASAANVTDNTSQIRAANDTMMGYNLENNNNENYNYASAANVTDNKIRAANDTMTSYNYDSTLGRTSESITTDAKQLLAMSIMAQAQPKFLLDSACNVHTTNDKSLLVNVELANSNHSVKVGNQQINDVECWGTMILKCVDNNSNVPYELVLKNVAYIPKIENLISSSLLIHSGQVKPLYQDWDHIILELSPSGRKIRIQGYNHCYPIQIIKINGTEAKALVVLKDDSNPMNQTQFSHIMLLHKRLGHISPQLITKLIKNNAIADMNSSIHINELTKISNLECVICALGKGYRQSFANHSDNTVKAKHIMFRLHADITGPMNQQNQSVINGLQDSNYYSVIIDEYSNYVFGKPIQFKSETDSHVMQITRHYEKLTKQSVVFLRCDGGGEYKSEEFLEFLSNKGIVKESTTPYTPQHNGKAERMMRTLADTARSIMIHSNSPTILWSLAYDTAAFIYNRTHITTIQNQFKSSVNKTPYELIYGIKPSINYLKTFGCNVTYNNNNDKGKTKLDQRQSQGIMVGYDLDSMSRQTIYRILDYDTLIIIRSRDVIFFENEFTLMNSLRIKLADQLNINSQQLRKADEQFYQQWVWNNYRRDSDIINELVQVSQLSEDKKGTDNSNTNSEDNKNNNDDSNPIYYENENILVGYQMNDIAHRERFLKTYIKPIVNNAKQVSRMKSIIQIHENSDKIPWSKICKNDKEFLKVCKEFVPNKLTEIQNNLQQFNSEASKPRVIHNPNPLNLINYESKELLVEGNDIFQDAPLSNPSEIEQLTGGNSTDETTGDNIVLQAHSVITHENSELISMSVSQLSGSNALGEFEPRTYSEAMRCIDHQKWKLAMDQEINALLNNSTWTLVSQLPAGRKAIPCKWVYKIKYDENGKPVRYKARLVVKGFMQKYGIDYNETYAPVMKYDSLRLLLAIATVLDLEIKQFDVDNAFLNAILNEDIYMQQPEGYVNLKFSNAVLKLLKSLYGLKQAPYEWNDDINETLLKLGFKRCASDSCVYYYENTFSGKPILIGLFVDDIIVCFDFADEPTWLKLKSYILQKYKIKEMGDAKFILGIRIIRDRPNRTLILDQSAYIDKILNKFDMKGYTKSPASRPGTDVMDLKFDPNEPILTQQLINRYQQMVGSLNYAAISTRPDISHSVSVCARYASKPQAKHLEAVNRVYSYLSGTIDKSLIMKAGSSSDVIHLSAYADSDHAGDPEERKSTSGFLIQLNNCLISWYSKKQTSVARSTCEAEIIAYGEAIKQLQWFRNFVQEIKLSYNNSSNSDPITLYCDNASSVIIGHKDLADSKTKHIAVNYNYVKLLVIEKIIDIRWIPSKNQLADVLTKALDRIKFKYLTDKIMGEC